MKKLGIITRINQDISIAIWDFALSTVIIKENISLIKNYEPDLLSIVEYNESTNTATTIKTLNFNPKEKEELLNILKEIIKIPYLNEAFLNQLDSLTISNKNPNIRK